MNTLLLSPHKDYEANRLRSGQLQLAAGTHLVLDETALENGQLDTKGLLSTFCLWFPGREVHILLGLGEGEGGGGLTCSVEIK